MEYDPATEHLQTISLHCFEEDELRVRHIIPAVQNWLFDCHNTHAHTHTMKMLCIAVYVTALLESFSVENIAICYI